MSAPAVHSVSTEVAPLFSFCGSIPPRRIPFAYRVTLALTAFAMVLLPLVYIALIVAAAYGVYLWAVYGVFLFQGSGGAFVKLAAYVAPLFAGGTLIAFMVKPLFARPAKQPDPFSLDLDRHPDLRTLISAICAKVGAPMPVRVDIDCQVNASAHLRRGLWSLGRRDLVLTIGLPLVNGLSARQLAGVLAHEFGHFAQGAGMAFTFVIRTVNAWFARVVFERDQWDANLTAWSEGGDFRIRLIVGLARGAVWLSRKLLHGLMLVGHGITCLQLRQMEYDADYYEIQLVGSEEFVATGRELSRLNAAGQAAFSDLGELWQTRQLVADFPDLVTAKRSRLPADVLAKIEEHESKAKTGWLDTHPSNPDRSAAARRMALPGILTCDTPARALFSDLPDVARAATRHFYRSNLGLTVDDSSLVSTENAQQAGATALASDAARTRLVGNILDLTRPLLWTDADFLPPAENAAVSIASGLASTRSDIERLRTNANHESTVYSSILEHLLLVEQAHALLSAGAKITPRTFNLAKSDLNEATMERAELARRRGAKVNDLQPFETAVRRWIALLGQAARSDELTDRLSSETRDELQRLTTALAALSTWWSSFDRWHIHHTILNVFFANHKALGDNKDFVRALQARFHDAARLADEAITLAGDAPIPLAATNGTTTARALLQSAVEGVEGAARLSAVLDTVAKTYFRLVSRVVALGEEVEKSIGVAPAMTAEPTTVSAAAGT